MPKYNKKCPPNLELILESNLSSSSIHSSETPLSFSSMLTPTTRKVKDFLDSLSLDEIEDLIRYNKNPIDNGQNGVVSRVTLSFDQDETYELVKKQGNSSVERENKITKAIQTVKANNFPCQFFSLPVAQGSHKSRNIIYTCYQEIGDLQTHRKYIYNQYNINPSSILSYLYQGLHQLLEAINALNSSEFIDKKGEIHHGIIHNDIKPSNIFLKSNGDFTLGDFGCAYFKDEVASQISTFQFSAPEIFINKDFCIKNLDNINADVWSLGASLWYLLTSQLISPTLPNEPSSDIEKILFYQDWAKKYSEQWQALVGMHLNLTDMSESETLSVKIKNSLEIDRETLQRNINDPKNTEIKKKILKKLALWMLAPLSKRPNAFDLKNLMDRMEAYYVVDGDAEWFADQLLERKKSENSAYQDQNNNKLVF